jgi:arylsulfatase A-like enzyme
MSVRSEELSSTERSAQDSSTDRTAETVESNSATAAARDPGKYGRWFRVLAFIGPNPAASILILAGVLAEVIALQFVPEPILFQPGPSRVQVPAILLLIWFHGVWAAWLILQSPGALGRRGWTRLAKAIDWMLTGAVIAGVSLAIGSWSMYLRTGRFANFESIQFVVRNLGESWLVEYLWRSEKLFVIGAGILTAVSAAALVPLIKAVQHGSWNCPTIAPSRIRFGRALVWLAIVLTVTTTQDARRRLRSPMLKRIWQEAATNRLHPLVTLAVTTAQAVFEEPIVAVIDRTELTPISANDWNVPPLGGDSPSVIFLAIESLRHDVVGMTHQGREVMPHLTKLSREGVQFTRAYAQSTHSDYSDVCIVSSLYPLRSTGHHYYTRTDPWPKKLIYDLLKPQGYATAIISSQNERWGGMDHFLETPNLDLYYDVERSHAATRLDRRDIGFAHEVAIGALRGGTLDDSHTTDRAIAWMKERAGRNERFFLTMNFQSSHFPYVIPEDVPRPFAPHTIDFDASFVSYPEEKTPVMRNAYYNAIHECDRQLGRIVEALRESQQLDNTILVVLGENGEAFHENGAVTHAGAPVEPCIHVALVVRFPERLAPRVEDYPTELVDVVPTVFGLMGLPGHPNFQGIDALSPHRVPLERRLLFFHTETSICRSDALLFQGRWKLIHDRETNVVRLHDLANDPGEAQDVSESCPDLARELNDVLRTWRARQLAYYHFPQYYLAAYPPAPPRASDALVEAAARAARDQQAATGAHNGR